MNIQCLKCKGAGMCGKRYCPHILKSKSMFKIKDKLSTSNFSGSSPAPFVGRFGYPNINVGILTPPEQNEEAWQYDAPKHWSQTGMSIPEIVDLRSALVNSRFKANIRNINNKYMKTNNPIIKSITKSINNSTINSKFLEIGQEIGMAGKPVDLEINLSDKPKFHLNPSHQIAPMGPNAELTNAKITSNPKIHTKVDKVVSDTDLLANDALNYLYKNKFDENFLSKLFSIGNLGIQKNRKLVPTRWSITAVDDTLGKNIHKQIINYPEITDYSAYFGNYLGNFYLILMVPDIWSYELFETYMPKASWNISDEINYTTDYEPYQGRKNYAANCAGGYYTVKLAILEKLKQLKRQGSCLVIRIITGDYSIPLGVWVTREAARKTVLEKPIKFATLDLMLKYTKALIKKKFGFDADIILKNSVLLKQRRTQTKLTNF